MIEHAEEIVVASYLIVNRWATRELFGTAKFSFWGESRREGRAR